MVHNILVLPIQSLIAPYSKFTHALSNYLVEQISYYYTEFKTH